MVQQGGVDPRLVVEVPSMLAFVLDGDEILK